MKTILILGGYGATGKPLARHLLQQTDTRLVIAGRHLEKAHALADKFNKEFNGGRVEVAFVDAGVGATLRKALVGIDLLLECCPYHREYRGRDPGGAGGRGGLP